MHLAHIVTFTFCICLCVI